MGVLLLNYLAAAASLRKPPFLAASHASTKVAVATIEDTNWLLDLTCRPVLHVGSAWWFWPDTPDRQWPSHIPRLLLYHRLSSAANAEAATSPRSHQGNPQCPPKQTARFW